MTDEQTISSADVEIIPSEAQPEPEPEVQLSPAAAAAGRLTPSQAAAAVVANGEPPEDLPESVFDRLSVERRVLGSISDDPHTQRLGSRNNLASLSDFLLGDPNVTSPPPPNHRLEVAGLTVEQAVQKVLDYLERLIEAGLVSREGDINDPSHTYHLTDAGSAELST